LQTETIVRGGDEYTLVWLKARVKGSKKPNFFIAQLDAPGFVEPPTFHLDGSAVDNPAGIPIGQWVDGRIRAVLYRSTGEQIDVQVLGEAVSYGPELTLPANIAE
jgi:hypothetical protein